MTHSTHERTIGRYVQTVCETCGLISQLDTTTQQLERGAGWQHHGDDGELPPTEPEAPPSWWREEGS